MSLEPRTAFLSLDEHPTLSECRNDNRFSVTLVESTAPMPDEIRKSSTVSALLVSMSLCSLAAEHFRLSVDGKIVPTRRVPAFRASVIDLAAEPSIWVGSPLRFVHFHVRRAGIDEVAADLGYERVGGFRLAVVEPDIVLAQITRSMLPHLGGATGPSPIALDHLELILDAHLLQHYAGVRQIRAATAVGLVASQRRRAEEILRANLDGRVRLSDVARECSLSVSHFARSFKERDAELSEKVLCAVGSESGLSPPNLARRAFDAHDGDAVHASHPEGAPRSDRASPFWAPGGQRGESLISK